MSWIVFCRCEQSYNDYISCLIFSCFSCQQIKFLFFAELIITAYHNMYSNFNSMYCGIRRGWIVVPSGGCSFGFYCWWPSPFVHPIESIVSYRANRAFSASSFCICRPPRCCCDRSLGLRSGKLSASRALSAKNWSNSENKQ